MVTTSSTLLVDNVQGSFNIGVGTVLFNNGSAILSIDGKTGIGTTVDGQIGSAATVSSFDVDPVFDGLHFKVNHRAHAMHNVSNRVSIKGIQPDTPITTLTADYAQSSLGNISVVDSSSFESFEGVGVGTTNYGYAIINDHELIAYTGVGNGQITGITTRGIGPNSFMTGNGGGQSTLKKSYNVGAQIRKYEANGINLRRINAFHSLNDVDTTKHPIGLDEYTIKVDMSADKGLNNESPGADRTGSGSLPAKFFNVTKTDGGSVTRITRNIQYETLTPNVSTSTPPGTSVSGKIRTISGSSVGGSEESFTDQGFEDITLNDMNHFDTPRLIASKINADANLTDIMPAGKSMVLEVILNSDNENVSPMIDCDRISAVVSSNRINAGDFVNGLGSTDTRVQESFMKRTKLTGQDPNASAYISKFIKLQNPATSLLVEFSAYRTEGSEIRCFYKTMEEGSNEDTFSRDFEPFPGFSNIDQFEKVIDPSRNTGEPDHNVPPSIGEEFKEYTFNSREIPSFTKFQIKIVMVGKNQAKPPKIKELRGIALA